MGVRRGIAPELVRTTSVSGFELAAQSVGVYGGAPDNSVGEGG